MLYDSPPHRMSLYSSSAANDAGGGVDITYTVAQANVACLINTASASTRLMYAQQDIVVTETVGVLSSYLTSIPQPGWKVIADDTGKSLLIHGIRSGRVSALGTIPPLTYLDCSEIL